jgi:pyrroloquinoline quinone biosynthesis protein E
VYLHITHRCTGACPHCYDRDSGGRDELSPDAWLDVISQAVAMGTDRFEIIGGDPFLRADLLDLIRTITGVHGARVRLFFNRALDDTEAASLAAAGHGLLTPLISLDGDENVNDRLRGRGTFRAVTGTARQLAAAGLRPVINTVLLRPALEGLQRLPGVLRDMGVTQLHLILPHVRGGLSRYPEMVPTGAELLEAFERLLPAASAAGVVVDNLGAWKSRLGSPRDLCSAGCSLLTVGPTGLVYACPITCGDPAFAAGDTRTTPLARIWRESAAFALVRQSSSRDRATCAACDVVDACGGECWVQAHYAARVASEPAGLTAPFPYCGLVRPVFADLLAAERRGPETSGGRPADVLPKQNPDLTPFECI